MEELKTETWERSRSLTALRAPPSRASRKGLRIAGEGPRETQCRRRFSAPPRSRITGAAKETAATRLARSASSAKARSLCFCLAMMMFHKNIYSIF